MNAGAYAKNIVRNILTESNHCHCSQDGLNCDLLAINRKYTPHCVLRLNSFEDLKDPHSRANNTRFSCN